jgi:hypothetical protein
MLKLSISGADHGTALAGVACGHAVAARGVEPTPYWSLAMSNPWAWERIVLRRSDALLMVVALVTGCALIGLAFYQGHNGPIAVPERVFYVAAAVFVLMPSLWAVVRKAG